MPGTAPAAAGGGAPARHPSHPCPRTVAAAAFAALRRDRVVEALLAACGATECHLVGGALRDRALGLVTHDLDAVVAGRGREIAGELAARLPARLVLLGGKEFAAYRLVIGARGDLAGAGSGGAGTPAAAAFPPAGAAVGVLDLWDRQSTSLHDDLARRDLTVNSFAVEPRGGAVVDPFGGLADLARRTLRATTAGSFDGDPLRVLRLVRLLVRLPGFGVEPATFELAHRAAPRLAEIAAERIREELWMTFDFPGADAPKLANVAGLPDPVPAHESPAPDAGLRALASLGLYPGLWLGAPGTPGGHPGADAAERAAAEIAALPACAAQLARFLGEEDAPAGASPAIDFAAARFAATFRHLSGASGSAGGDEAIAALGRMHEEGRLSGRHAAEIAPLLAEPPELPETDLDRRRFLHRLGPRWLTAACSIGAAAMAADAALAVAGPGPAAAGPSPAAAGERWQQAARLLCELARREGPELISPPRLLGGDEVQRLLGIPAGPEIGAALAALTAAQVEGLVRTRKDAERFLRDRFR